MRKERIFSSGSPIVNRLQCTAEAALTVLKTKGEISSFSVTHMKRRHNVLGIHIFLTRAKDSKQFESQLNLREVKSFDSMKSYFRDILNEIHIRGGEGMMPDAKK